MWPSPIFENIFFRLKMPEICRKNRFFGIFSRFHHLFFLIFCTKMRIRNVKNVTESDFRADFHLTFSLYFVVFSHKNIINFNAHHMHGSFVNKTDFCSRIFLKVAGTADFHRKKGISWNSLAELYIFSWNLAHRCKLVISKIWRSPIFEKHIFPAKIPVNMPEKTVFGNFSGFHHLFFLVLCAKMRIINAQNMTESDFRENFFYGRKWRKYPRYLYLLSFV